MERFVALIRSVTALADRTPKSGLAQPGLRGPLHARFGVDAPDTDHRRLATLDGSVAYIADALNRRGRT